ncbi:hypothetical protein T484DRAFT_1834876 [Baffinella frigidus]|nr:hypothetical protein T484DRAFT_1834876 [Cryptophyta sp. CCMP2293]
MSLDVSCYSLSRIDSADPLNHSTTSAAATVPSISAPSTPAPSAAAASTPRTSSHLSNTSSTVALSAEDAVVPAEEAPSSGHACLASIKAVGEMDALQALRDSLTLDFAGLPLDASCFSSCPIASSSTAKTSSHASLALITVAPSEEEAAVEEEEAPRQWEPSGLTLATGDDMEAIRGEIEALQALTDKIEAILNAPRAFGSATFHHTQANDLPPAQPTADEPASSVTDAEISDERAERRWWSDPAIRSWMDGPGTPPGKPMPLKAARTPLPPEMQAPCLFIPPVVHGRHGWAAAPVRSRVRGMEEDSTVRGRQALAPWLTPLDARQQCPALFLSHGV